MNSLSNGYYPRKPRVAVKTTSQKNINKFSKNSLQFVEEFVILTLVIARHHLGESSNGRIPVSKTVHGGSNPSSPAREKA